MKASLPESFALVVLNDTCEVDGGAARIAIEDARQMAARGHRVIFLSACGTPPDDGGGIEWLSLGQRNILQEPRRWLAMSRGLWNFQAAWAVKRVLRGLPPGATVVHLHSWSKALSGSVLPAARACGAPVVATLHDYFAVCPNGGLYDYPTQEVCRLEPMSRRCVQRHCDSRSYAHKLWRVLRQWIWRYAAGIPGRFRLAIAVSAFSQRKLSPWLHIPPVRLVENLPKAQRQPFVEGERRFGAVYAGRVAAEKGVELYLQACRLAGTQGQVWGDGPVLAELKSRWPEAAFAGWLQPTEMQQRLRQARVLVVPSLWYETYGMVVAEAAAAGVAVIVADHGAAADLVEDGVTGLLFRAGDAADLANKMRYLNENTAVAIKMGRAAYERFWADHGLRREQRMNALTAVYAESLDRQG